MWCGCGVDSVRHGVFLILTCTERADTQCALQGSGQYFGLVFFLSIGFSMF
jgi:hypothetical protein